VGVFAQLRRSIAVALLAVAACPIEAGQPAPSVRAFQDRVAIEEVVVALANATDSRDWQRVEKLLTDQVDLGYRSLVRSDAPIRQRTSPAQFVAASKATLPGFLHTQHLIGNMAIDVQGDRADVSSQVSMSHYLPNDAGLPYWIVVGTYQHKLVRTASGWKISAMDVLILFELGNDRLQKLAAERVKAGLGKTTP
jgi:3-phenylpropionate/cinnamic acid dioxygenase small subunit